MLSSSAARSLMFEAAMAPSLSAISFLPTLYPSSTHRISLRTSMDVAAVISLLSTFSKSFRQCSAFFRRLLVLPGGRCLNPEIHPPFYPPRFIALFFASSLQVWTSSTLVVFILSGSVSASFIFLFFSRIILSPKGRKSKGSPSFSSYISLMFLGIVTWYFDVSFDSAISQFLLTL